jgi:DNA-binding GntR family transcriptional regulator
LRAAIREMDLMAKRKDAYGLAAADTEFHRALCRLGGNSVTTELWETLARQFTIIFGLASLSKPMPAIVAEHPELLAAIESGRMTTIRRTLDEHIRVMNHAVDYEAIIAARRAQRGTP